MDVDGRKDVRNGRLANNKPRMKLNFVSSDSSVQLELPSDRIEEFLKDLERHNARSLPFVFQYERDGLLPLDRFALILGVNQDVCVQESARELCGWFNSRNWLTGSRNYDLIARDEIGEASPYFLGKDNPVVRAYALNPIAGLRPICANGPRPG